MHAVAAQWLPGSSLLPRTYLTNAAHAAAALQAPAAALFYRIASVVNSLIVRCFFRHQPTVLADRLVRAIYPLVPACAFGAASAGLLIAPLLTHWRAQFAAANRREEL